MVCYTSRVYLGGRHPRRIDVRYQHGTSIRYLLGNQYHCWQDYSCYYDAEVYRRSYLVDNRAGDISLRNHSKKIVFRLTFVKNSV